MPPRASARGGCAKNIKAATALLFNRLPSDVRKALAEVLRGNYNFASDADFGYSRDKINKVLYEKLGKAIKDVPESKNIHRFLNPSAQGSVGNWFVQNNFITGHNLKEFEIASKLWSPAKQNKRYIDNLLITGRTLLEIKTGYPDGYPSKDDVEQLLDYVGIIKASRDPLNKDLREYLRDKGKIPSGDLSHLTMLFVPSDKTNAEEVARKSFGKIENAFYDKEDLKYVKVYYLDNDGKIYRLEKDKDKKVVSVLVGDKIPN